MLVVPVAVPLMSLVVTGVARAMSAVRLAVVTMLVVVMTMLVVMRDVMVERQAEPELESAMAFGAGGVTHQAQGEKDGRGAEDELAHGVSPQKEVTAPLRVPGTGDRIRCFSYDTLCPT